MVYSGMGPDFRVLADKARKVSHTHYKRIYNEYPPTRILVQDVAKVMQEATQSGGVRPYGVSLLVAGWDDKPAGTGKGGPALYQVDPSGSYFPWKATAIGKSATSAKTFLEKRYADGLELEDAIHIALLTLKETVRPGVDSPSNRQPCSPVPDRGRDERRDHRNRHRGPARRPPAGLRGRRGGAGAAVPEAESAGGGRLSDELVVWGLLLQVFMRPMSRDRVPATLVSTICCPYRSLPTICRQSLLAK